MNPLRWLRAKLGDVPAATPLDATRVLVLDIDVTGTDSARDRATGVAILPVDAEGYRLADLRYRALPPQNDDPRAQEWDLADQLVVTFNTNFVRHMLARAPGMPLPNCRWLDMRTLLDGAFGKEMGRTDSLPSWQARLGVAVGAEHSAVADVHAMAQLYGIVLARCEALELHTLDDLLRAGESQAWLRGT